MGKLPAEALGVYEKLRGEVIHGQARPEGLGAIAFHGMWRGLAMLGIELPSAPGNAKEVPLQQATIPKGCDRELVELLASMVLATEREVRYVY